MDWISWRASHEEAEAEPKQKRIGCRCLFPKSPPLQEGRGLNQTRRWLCRPTMDKLQIMRSWKDFAYCHYSWATGREVLRSHVYWQIMMKGAVLGHFPRRVDPYGDRWRPLKLLEHDLRLQPLFGDYAHRLDTSKRKRSHGNSRVGDDFTTSFCVASEILKISSF